MSDLVNRLRDQEKSFSEDWLVMLEASDRIEALEAALQRIAAYDDKLANDRLLETGSYGSFDEPGSVQVARRALEGK